MKPYYYLLFSFLLFANGSLVSAQPLLVESARQNNLADVASLLKQGENVNTVHNDGTSALHWAAHWDNKDLAKLLIQAKADPNLANAYGVTPLHLACTNKSSAMANILVKAGASPDSKLWSGETPLMNCARRGAVAAVELMIGAGADVNATETEKAQTALMWAAAGGHSDVVKTLVENGANVTAVSSNGFTPLLFAARSGDVDTAKFLVQAGANPNESTEEQGNTLVVASASGHEALSIYLLQQGAEPDSTDQYGVTALHNSIRNGMSTVNGVRYDAVYRVRPENMPELTKNLLEAGADPNAQIQKSHRLGPDGSAFEMTYATPLILAALSSDVGMMNLLAEYEADSSLTARGGVTPLIAAAQSACTGSCAFQGGNQSDSEKNKLALEAVKAAVEMGIDVNARTEKGQTAMHMAAFIGADDIVQYLADQGADVNVSDKYGETPWSMASGISPVIRYQGLYGKHESTAALLLKLGAKVVSREQMDDRSPPPPGQ